MPTKHQAITTKHQKILTKHQAIASRLKMQTQLVATFDAIFAWTDPLRLRKLAQIPYSLPSDIAILKEHNISLSLALRWLAHNWSRYTMTI